MRFVDAREMTLWLSICSFHHLGRLTALVVLPAEIWQLPKIKESPVANEANAVKRHNG
jgi:hypothetical protein